MKNKFLQFLGLTKRAGKLLEGYNKCEDAMKRRGVSSNDIVFRCIRKYSR